RCRLRAGPRWLLPRLLPCLSSRAAGLRFARFARSLWRHLLRAVLELHGPASAWYQSLRPEDHDENDRETEDEEPELEQVGVEDRVTDAAQPIGNVRDERPAENRTGDVA